MENKQQNFKSSAEMPGTLFMPHSPFDRSCMRSGTALIRESGQRDPSCPCARALPCAGFNFIVASAIKMMYNIVDNAEYCILRYRLPFLNCFIFRKRFHIRRRTRCPEMN